jgi:hypothetical protein
MNERASTLSSSMENSIGGWATKPNLSTGVARPSYMGRETSISRSSTVSGTPTLNSASLANHLHPGMEFKAPVSPPPIVSLPSPSQSTTSLSSTPTTSSYPTDITKGAYGPFPLVPSPPLPEKSRLRTSPELQHGSNVRPHIMKAPLRKSSSATVLIMQQSGGIGPIRSETYPAQSTSPGLPTRSVPPNRPIPPTPTDGTSMSANWGGSLPGLGPDTVRRGANIPQPLNVRRMPSFGPAPGSPTTRSPGLPATHIASVQRPEVRLAEQAAAEDMKVQSTPGMQYGGWAKPKPKPKTPASMPVAPNAIEQKARPAFQQQNLPGSNSAPASKPTMKLFPSIALRKTPTQLAKEEQIVGSTPEESVSADGHLNGQSSVSSMNQRYQNQSLQGSPQAQITSPILLKSNLSDISLNERKQRTKYTDSVYSDDTAAAASSQALPSRDTSALLVPTTRPSTSSPTIDSGNPRSRSRGRNLQVVDFNVLIPRVMSSQMNLPLRPEDVEEQLRREKDAVLATQDSNAQLTWAENIMRQTYIMSKFKKRLAKAGYQQVLPSLAADGLTLEAKNIIERNIRDGLPRALFLKARWFDLEDPAIQELYLSALSKGYLRAAYYLGKKYESRKDYSTAFEYYRKGAYAQDSACGYRLAKIFLKGELGKKKDHKTAVPLLVNAASCADKDAPFAPYVSDSSTI